MKNKKRELQKPQPAARIIRELPVKVVREILGLGKGAIRNPDGTVAKDNKKVGTLQDDYERWS